jgi:CRISPR/Cas system CSM-associated protein Csm2 small subunit
MDSRKHIYYVTVGDVQTVAEDTVGRKLREKELQKVIDKILDRIQWYDVVEDAIAQETAVH